MVCRGLMLALHRAGHIELPAKRQSARNNVIAHRRVAEVAAYDTSPIAGSLAALGPLEIRLVRRTEGEKLFAHLLSRYHYLGYSRPVGEHLKYLVLAGGRAIACLGWSSATRQLNLRDQFVGSLKEAYGHNLHCIAYDASVGVMVGIMRYGSGMPFYRLERLQDSLGVPLPSSVQWEQASQSAVALEPIFDHLTYLGAHRIALADDAESSEIELSVGAYGRAGEARAGTVRA